MKSFIIPVAATVSLIAIFSIISCQKSTSEDVCGVQTENTKSSKSPDSILTSEHTVETQPVTESTSVAETKPVINTTPETEARTGDEKLSLAGGRGEVASDSKTIIPEAIPILSPEEACKLIKQMETEREDAAKRGQIFYEETFYSIQNVSASIQQTVNWKFVPNGKDSNEDSFAKKQEYFSIKTSTPLEYDFAEPLLEHTIYIYTLCCSVKGKGTVVLSQKNGESFKSFSIDSSFFETVSFTLGDGSSLDRKIIPLITFQGDLQVESITLNQKVTNDQWTVCIGKIEDISNVPDIEQANYPDCYYTARFVVKDILDGKPAPQNIQLLIPAFLDSKIDPLSTIMKKGFWKVSIRPFSLATKKEQEIEQVDDIESYLDTPYILVSAITGSISEYYTSCIPVLERETYISPFDNPVNPPIPDKFIEDSKNEIKKELAKVNLFIEQVSDEEKINDIFQASWNEKQKLYDSLNSETIWAKEQNSFFALPKKWDFIPSAPISEETLDAIVAFNSLLKSNGIQLIIQIVPDYRDIAALVLNPEFRQYGDQRSAKAVKQLLERGIETQYVSDEIVKHAFDYERLFGYPSDYHPEGAVDIMTQRMAKRLDLFKDVFPQEYSADSFKVVLENIPPKTWPTNPDVNIGVHTPGELIQAPHIYYDNKLLMPTTNSKILVIGNSFTQSPQVKGYGYVSQLTAKILYNSSVKITGGVGALTVLPKFFLTNPDSLKGKLVVILPISIRFLTEKQYSIPNILNVDKDFKETKTEYITDLPIKTSDRPIFPHDFNFSYNLLPNYLPFRTSSTALSSTDPSISLSVPEDITANSVRIAVQPLYNYAVTLLVNGTTRRLPSRYFPEWEILEVEIDKDTKKITIELDTENCSSKDAKVLIGNVSLFE